MQTLSYANLWRPIRFLWCAEKIIGVGVWNRKCKRPHRLAPLNHGICLCENAFVNLTMWLSHYEQTMLQQIGAFLKSTSDDPLEEALKKLSSMNHYEEHVASSVIARGTLLFHSNLFVLFFQGLLRLKRTDAPLPFCSGLSTWLSVQQSRKRGPVHVPSDWHVAHILRMEEARRELCM